MPEGVSSQWTRIWNMEWNGTTVQIGVLMPKMIKLLPDTWPYTICTSMH